MDDVHAALKPVQDLHITENLPAGPTDGQQARTFLFWTALLVNGPPLS